MIATTDSAAPQSLSTASAAVPSPRSIRAAARKPPSARDISVYRFVEFACNSTREAALEFGISQTRVRQVIGRVVEFFLDTASRRGPDEDPREAGLRVAEHLAGERLRYLYERAIKAFDDTYREDVHGNLLPGKGSYLNVAGRMALWMSQVPVHALPRIWEEEQHVNEPWRKDQNAEEATVENEHEDEEEDEEEYENENDATSDQPPPDAECSPRAVSRGDSSPAAAAPDDVSVPAEGTYRSLDEIKAEARRSFLRPAQTTLTQSIDSPASGDCEALAADPLHARTPRSRRERRARERRRKRHLSKR